MFVSELELLSLLWLQGQEVSAAAVVPVVSLRLSRQKDEH